MEKYYAAYEWYNTNYFINAEDREEIIRRVTLVKHHIIFDLLAASGNPISTNGILNHVAVLLQQPVIILLYKESKRKGVAEWVPHFDFHKTKDSRGSLELRDRQQQPIEIPEDVQLKNSVNEGLFKIFDTTFFVRVFLLEEKEQSEGSFIELTTKSPPAINIKSPLAIKERRRTHKKNRREYCRLCLVGLFTFDDGDKSNYGITFLDGITEKLESVLLEQVYETPKEDRRSRTLLREDQKKARNAVETYFSNALGGGHGLDRIYTRAKFASKAIKMIGPSGAIAKNIHGDEFSPNIIFSLRAYDRTEPRCVRKLPNGHGTFRGYAHNVSFAIPFHQQENIKRYFANLAEKGASKYFDERYGPARWSFFHSGYRNFAYSLDQWFWSQLKRGGSSITLLLKILISKVGSGSTSIVDPVFYYGSAMYRVPFRCDGGLDRIYGLKDIFSSLPEHEKTIFSIASLDGHANKELRRDCFRVVIFFYLTRMLGPELAQKADYWTKLIIFPLDVSGAVVGTIGCVSFEPKLERDQSSIPSVVELPIHRGFWNQEFYFFSEIVSSAQRVLRQQYRDFQIKQISIAFAEALNGLVESTKKNEGNTKKSMVDRLVDILNSESIAVARACPYPRYVFSWMHSADQAVMKGDMRKWLAEQYIATTSQPAFVTDAKTVDVATSEANDKIVFPVYIDIGTKIRLVAQISKQEEVFRGYYTTPGFSEVLRENMYSLKAKLDETVKIVLDKTHAATARA